MSIKTIIRGEEEEEEVNHNWVGATLAAVVFMFAFVLFPKYVTRHEASIRKYYG